MRILKLYYFVGHKICSKVLILFPFYEPYPDSFLHCGNVFLFNMFCFLPFLSIGKLKRMLHYSDLLSFCLAETFFVQHVKTQRKIRLDFPGKFFEFSLLGPPRKGGTEGRELNNFLRKIQHDLSLGFGVLFFTFSFYRKIEKNATLL